MKTVIKKFKSKLDNQGAGGFDFEFFTIIMILLKALTNTILIISLHL